MTAIDLSHRIIQTTPPAPQANRFHAGRRFVQLCCILLIVALPLRVDMRSGVSYLFWHRMASRDSLSLFLLSMLAVWGLVTVSFLYGRLWCGYLCPQTHASDFADSLKGRLDRIFRARPGRLSFLVSRGVWSIAVALVSLAAGAVAVCYFLDPAAVGRALIDPARDPVAGAWVFGIAAVLAADMLWVRRKLCAGVCQYGALIGLLGDKNTLAVRYLDERADDCIHCGRCEAVCPMEIDIKKGVGQIGCIGCGECVDACSDILGRRGVAGIIEYRYGVEPERSMRSLTWPQRLGLWDARRVAVVLVAVACAVACGVSSWASFPSRLSIMANGAVDRSGGLVRDGYTLALRNGSSRRQVFHIAVADGVLRADPASIAVDGHDDTMTPVTVLAPAAVIRSGASISTALDVTAGPVRLSAPIIFIAPRH